VSGIDLLLVRPPANRPSPAVVPPLGLLYVAAAARQAGYSVALLDAQAEDRSWEQTIRQCRTLSPSVIGLGGCSPMLGEFEIACRRLRPCTGSIVVGGPIASADSVDLLTYMGDVDAVVVGEAEHTIAPLLAWLAHGGEGPPPPGIATRDHEPTTPDRVRDLDDLPPPSRDLLPRGRYRYPIATRAAVTTAITSRGCSHRCIFCDKRVSGSVPRLHSSARVVDDLADIVATERAGYVVFFDDEFTVDPQRVGDICEGILTRGLDLHWKCEARAEPLDPALLALMRRAGCRAVAMGVESALPASLRWLRKDLEPDQIREAFERCRAAGIETLAYALVGIPGEGPKDVLATVAFCREMGVRWLQLSTLSPYPGTPLFDEAQREGWLVHTTVRNPADAEQLRPTLIAPPWDITNLGTTLLRSYAGFYLTPATLLQEVAATRPSLNRARAAARMARWFATESLIGWARTSGLADVLFPDPFRAR